MASCLPVPEFPMALQQWDLGTVSCWSLPASLGLRLLLQLPPCSGLLVSLAELLLPKKLIAGDAKRQMCSGALWGGTGPILKIFQFHQISGQECSPRLFSLSAALQWLHPFTPIFSRAMALWECEQHIRKVPRTP